jgi:hypothetical protein
MPTDCALSIEPLPHTKKLNFPWTLFQAQLMVTLNPTLACGGLTIHECAQ